LKEKIRPLGTNLDPAKIAENYHQNINGNLMNNLFNVDNFFYISAVNRREIIPNHSDGVRSLRRKKQTSITHSHSTASIRSAPRKE
jgi:hypothetical protein